MPQDRANASSSHIKVEAAEAVVHTNGRIERKAPTVSSDDEVSRSNLAASIILSNAVNDIFGNEDQAIPVNDRPVVRPNYSRYFIYSAFGLVFAGFIWSLISILFDKKQETNTASREVVQYAKKVEDSVTGSPVEQMEQLANLVIQDNDWSLGRIKLFRKHWGNSDDLARLKVENQAWFHHFLYRLETEINNRKKIGQINLADANSNGSQLISLGVALGLSKNIGQPVNVAQNAQVLGPQKSATDKEPTAKNETQNNNQLNAGSQKTEIAKSNDKSKLNTALLSAGTSTTGAKQTTEPNKKVVTKIPERPTITSQDISRVLNQYKAAYEKGSMQDMASLFGIGHPQLGKKIISELKQNFENIFSNSSRRQIDFNAVNWRILGDSVTVDSDFYASLELLENRGIQYTKGSTRINMHRVGSKLFISNIESILPANNKANRELSLSSAGNSGNADPQKITSEDLRKIVGRFIHAYESGNVERMSNLLAENAKSNDKLNRDGITKDYAELFKISSHRQLLIRNMAWDKDGGTAKGTGDVEAFVFRGEEQLPYTMRGKIQIVAKKQNGKVVITHLYHIERAK